MNLIEGKLVDQNEALQCLSHLPDIISNVLASSSLQTDEVIEACDKLSHQINEEEHLPLLLQLGFGEQKARFELQEIKQMLSRSYLSTRMQLELGAPKEDNTSNFYMTDCHVQQRYEPLGVLFHIAAGNASGLPVYSVIEGLLTRNINLLKLAGGDDGITVGLLQTLIKLEPKLANYVFVFDLPSTDVVSMKQLADVADAIVTWGGDVAIVAVRALASPNTKLLEWGHKRSFAYLTKSAIKEEVLREIAVHICDSEQLYCSSCQGIYLDTDDQGELEELARLFSSILQETSMQYPQRMAIGQQAQISLQRYTKALEHRVGEQFFPFCDGSVHCTMDVSLTTSLLFRNPWVKPLPKTNIISTLKPNKGYLQTVALYCEEEEREELERLLVRAGVVRITQANRMSYTYCGMPHDGAMSLPLYMKKVSIETKE